APPGSPGGGRGPRTARLADRRVASGAGARPSPSRARRARDGSAPARARRAPPHRRRAPAGAHEIQRAAGRRLSFWSRTRGVSRLDPGAVSDAGARGLLQLMPETARQLGVNGDDPSANVLAGARYLRQLLNRYGSVELALAAYNVGPTTIDRAGHAPATSLRYAKNVQARAALLTC